MLFSEETLGGFGAELYRKNYLYLLFVFIFKIMCFGMMFRVPGFGESFGHFFLILSM